MNKPWIVGNVLILVVMVAVIMFGLERNTGQGDSKPEPFICSTYSQIHSKRYIGHIEIAHCRSEGISCAVMAGSAVLSCVKTGGIF